MATRKRNGRFQVVLAGMLLSAFSGLLPVAHAQTVTPSGLGTLVNGSATPAPAAPGDGLYNVTGGTRPGNGANLFHSFGEFRPQFGETASFLNVDGSGVAGSSAVRTNILARVTGGNPSDIFGTIRTQAFTGGANLFLMNPNGIIFGPSAQLDLSGSFHATTADYVKLGNNGIFYADPAQTSLLTAAEPSAFGFLSANPKPIEVQTGSLDFDFETGDFLIGTLKVPDGETFSLVGGNAAGSQNPGVSIGAMDGSAPGYVLAPAGRVNLVSVASPGLASMDAVEGFKFDGANVNGDRFTQLGGIRVGPGSVVDGKEIFIRGGQLTINDGVVMPSAFAFAVTFGVDPVTRLPLTGLPNGGQVNVKVTGDVTLTGSPFNFPAPTSQAGGIVVYSGSPFFVTDAGKVPDVTIEAGSVSVSGFSAIQARRNTAGEASNVRITADKVLVGSGGAVVLTNTYAGDGPNLIIAAREVDITGDGSPSVYNVEGLFDQGLKNGNYPFSTDPVFITGNSGNISIEATDSLSVRGLGQITTDSLIFGNAGNITIKAGNVLVAGTGDAQSALIGSQSSLTGDAGNITINATGSITVKDGGRITSASLGSGNAGNVSLNAAGPITLSGQDARIVGATFQPPDSQLNALFESIYGGQAIFDADGNFIGIAPFNFDFFRNQMGNPSATLMQVLAYMSSNAIELPGTTPGPVTLIPISGLDVTPGNAGTVSVTTPQLTLNSGTRIETSTGWEGNAGSVIGNVGMLSVLDGGAIRSRSGVEFLDGTSAVGPGQGGSVTLTATDSISVSGQASSISTTTFGDGNAGNISLSANQVAVQGGGRVTSESGGTLNGQFFAGTGNAGQITASTPTLTMGDGGTISVTTSGAGNAGNIALNVTNFTQTGGARVDSSTSGSGAGGDLTVTAANLASLSGTGTGLFSTASSTGAGGDINVQAPQVEILNGATMSADSTGTATATAGNVNIVTSDLNMQNSSITTGATLADGGNISITTTGSTVHLTNSEITTSVQSGVGGGGNITIDSDLVFLDDSRILANAFGGPGGNINITADIFLVNVGGMLPTSLAGIVDASSALSSPGIVNLPEITDISESVAQLPEAPLQATELLRASCAARFAGGKASSLVLGGRDGVPTQPGGLLPSPLYLATDGGSPATGVKTSAYAPPTRFSLLGSVDSKNRLLNQYSLLPNFKCAL